MSRPVKLRKGYKGFLALLLIAWPASWLGIDHNEYSSGVVQALPLALFASFLAWLGARSKTDREFTFFSASVGFMLIGIGIIHYGARAGNAKDAGLDSTEAATSALAGWSGILIVIGLIAVVVRGFRTKRNIDAKD